MSKETIISQRFSSGIVAKEQSMDCFGGYCLVPISLNQGEHYELRPKGRRERLMDITKEKDILSAYMDTEISIEEFITETNVFLSYLTRSSSEQEINGTVSLYQRYGEPLVGSFLPPLRRSDFTRGGEDVLTDTTDPYQRLELNFNFGRLVYSYESAIGLEVSLEDNTTNKQRAISHFIKRVYPDIAPELLAKAMH